MLATLIPLFDGDMKVCAYSIFAQRDNSFLNPGAEGIGRLDGAAQIPGFELVDSVGAGTLADDQEIFVEVNNINIFTDISSRCEAPHEKIVLLTDPSLTPDENYVGRLSDLKIEGYKLAIRKLEIRQFEPYREILRLMDYILLDHHKINISQAKIYFGKLFPKIRLCAVNVNSQEDYDKLMAEINKRQMDTTHLWWYLDTRKYGTCPHAGFGLGFERLILFVTGMQNIRDVIPFPRTPNNAEF